MTKQVLMASVCAASALFFPAVVAAEDAPALQDLIIVTGRSLAADNLVNVTPDRAPLEGADTSRLLARVPGGARIANGELSGQFQYRGLTGERLNLRVDGQHFASGGPNLMDPPLHYAPMSLISQIVVDRGVSPVSSGPGLAGGANAVFKKMDYAAVDEVELGYDLTLGARSADESVSLGGMAGAATDKWRVNVIGAHEEGSNTSYPNGTIGGSAYERRVLGFASGVKFGRHEISLDVRRQEAGPAGNPPFPMDIRYLDSQFAKLGYAGGFDRFDVEAGVDLAGVEHAMNNFDLRPEPASPQRRESLTSAETRSAHTSVSFAQFDGRLTLGLDVASETHDVRIVNPANVNFFVDAIPGAKIDRFGGFAQWRGKRSALESELGLRIDHHSADVGDAAIGSALPAAPGMLAMNYNAADRNWDATGVDAVARFWTPEKNGLSWRATLAHKTKAPGYLERFGWMPLSASGGLADGNIYVGDLNLELEKAWLAEAGFDYFGGQFYARPTLFVRQIDNFVQGVPFDETVGVIDTPQEMIAAMSGDPTPLRFANVDARLYGFDADFGYDFEGPLRLDSVLSYVRGERRDTDDNLYRISPPSLSTSLTWDKDIWSASFEVRGVARQHDISASNSEAETPGYVLLNLLGEWTVKQGVHLSFGVENLLDQTYRDHLSGYNRNTDSDVAPGTRLPGAGRSAFLKLSVAS